jgi:hypothetical protein
MATKIGHGSFRKKKKEGKKLVCWFFLLPMFFG